MSTQRDVTRIVRSWLKVDAHESADRVLDAVLDALPATPQRRVSWLARRSPVMSTTMRIVLAAAAVAAAAFIGYQALPRSGVGTNPTPTSSPSATSSPTLAPTATAAPAGLLPPGTHVLWDSAGVPMTVTIPGPGWYGEPGNGFITKDDTSGAPDGAGIVVFPGIGDLFVYGDPCQWTSSRPDTPASTVDDFVAALAAQPSRDATQPVGITVGGYAGKSITLHVPDDAVFDDCQRGEFRSFVAGVDAARYHQDPGQIDEVWVVDVNGKLVVIDLGYFPGTPAADLAELRSVADSIVFE
ncbi:MAG TPA: hypothetical protein VFM19_07910 [Candidatus Limnocylindria bacterium]|nr:hypothetical protein [Candidatus Limnocylindria bacterium]